MKKIILSTGLLMLSIGLFAQDIKLPAPQKNGGKPLMQVLQERKSERSYSSQALSEQTLSNLLWAAYGFSRDSKRTAPSANNKQEFEIYVALEKGMYLYNAADNTLELKVEKDLREATGRQPFVKTAPVNLVYVYDSKIQGNEQMAYVDCGFIAQNVYLYCASEGLANVVRGLVEKDSLAKLMNLPENKKIALAHTVGYSK